MTLQEEGKGSAFFLLVQSVSPILPYMGPLYRIPRHECGECMKRGGRNMQKGKREYVLLYSREKKRLGFFPGRWENRGCHGSNNVCSFASSPSSSCYALLTSLSVPACLQAHEKKEGKERRKKIYCPLHPPPAFIPTPVFFLFRNIG